MQPADSFLLALQPGPPARAGDFDRAARLLRKRAGILLGAHKRDMAERKLSLAARAMGQSAVSAYLDYLEQHADDEQWAGFINGFTINHTAFFRERHHFRLLASHMKGRPRPLSVWCCACSTGEEAYSIAITLHELCGGKPGSYSVLATDIDTRALATARQGVYASERVSEIDPALLRNYFQRGVGREGGRVRIVPALRDTINFEPLNLLDKKWPEGRFDAIFCRNTMIYFDKQTQARLLERFARMLPADGLLFAGHSENFTYLTRALRLRGQTVYEVTP